MLIYKLVNYPEQIEAEQLEAENCPALILTSASGAAEALKLSGIEYDGELSLDSIAFSKIETQNGFLFGTLCIPKLLDVAGSRYKIMLFINRRSFVIIDNLNFSFLNGRKCCEINCIAIINRPGTSGRFLHYS